MKKALLLLVLSSYFLLPLQAQSRYTYGGNRSRGNIEIKGDVAVKQLVEKHIDLNERVRTIPGFRIQVASLSGTASKNRAFEMKERLKVSFPEVEAYVVYDEPNFKVKVGDFRTRLEAYAFLQQIIEVYKGYIIKDNIYPEPPTQVEYVPDDQESEE